MNSGTARTPPLASASLSTAGAAPGSIIAAIITTHTAMKNANEPSLVATPISIPCICHTAMPQHVAAIPSAAVSAAAIAPVLAVATVAVNPWLAMMPSGFVQRGSGGPVEVVLQGTERAVPVAGQGGQELLGHLHRRGTHPVADPAPLPGFGGDQAGLGEQGQVLGDRL